MKYTQRKFRAGGVHSSVTSLVTATLDSATIAFPYAVAMNGLVFGPFLILMTGVVSYFTGMLLVDVAAITKKNRYEDMARTLYNPRVEKIVSGILMGCLISFSMSYIVFMKQTTPFIIEKLGAKLPGWCNQSQLGQTFWAVFFSVFIVFPLAIPRQVGTLRFASLFGVLCSVYLCFTVLFSFFFDKATVPSVQKAWAKAQLFKFSFDGMVNSLPLIIFAFLNQVVIPQVYGELVPQNYKRMRMVVFRGNFLGVFLYSLIGVFGYLSFTDNPEKDLDDKNILLAPYINNTPILIGNFAVLFATAAAAPMAILPCKDSIEEMRFKEGMTSRQNLVVTILIVFVSMLLALVIPGIGYSLTLAGCTFNPAIGFFIPIFFYFKATPEEPYHSPKKICCILTFIIILAASILGFYNFILSLVNFHKE